MIDHLNGTLVSKKPTNVIIETNGIAFSVNITLPAFKMLPAINSYVKIITHLHIKENPISFVLYGFSDEKERDMFRQIISVSGVGPKTALSILSAVGSRELSEIIMSGNYSPLTSITGVGRKTAERLVLELKDKIARGETDIIPSHLNKTEFDELSKMSNIISALVNLGYNRTEADKLVTKISLAKNIMEMHVEDVIKEILRG